MHPLILASNSPRRRKLLATLNHPFRVIPPEVDETIPEGTPPEAVAKDLAIRKAQSVAATLEEGLVLGADTLVAIGNDIIGKPDDSEHAREILHRLSHNTHIVITGLCLIDAKTGEQCVDAECTRVTMRPMTPEEIDRYVDSGEGLGKAGAYAIQETGDRFVERVEGSFSNVIGLPMELLRQMLNEMEESAPERACPS